MDMCLGYRVARIKGKRANNKTKEESLLVWMV
jgi:hypothetical protein